MQDPHSFLITDFNDCCAGQWAIMAARLATATTRYVILVVNSLAAASCGGQSMKPDPNTPASLPVCVQHKIIRAKQNHDYHRTCSQACRRRSTA
ncbi:hypothetical protein NDU88_002055 [Pleurodeles waltl]|uniref:Uncharacterized protein n=1 Tax=Pleurodeles waltl TaxID=8319 RepID=A0AAV7LBD3_PLEWA|nr:hypothetical protein NDU88_002055 [Pleurodeles waltl]